MVKRYAELQRNESIEVEIKSSTITKLRHNSKYKFISNWSASKLQGAKQLDTENIDFIVIQKAMKDLMLMHEYDIPSVAPTSENTPISDKVLKKLQDKYKKVVF